jgi:hypothetical protein
MIFQVTISLLNPYKKDLYFTLAPIFDTDIEVLINKTKESLKTLYDLKNNFNEILRKDLLKGT